MANSTIYDVMEKKLGQNKCGFLKKKLKKAATS